MVRVLRFVRKAGGRPGTPILRVSCFLCLLLFYTARVVGDHC